MNPSPYGSPYGTPANPLPHGSLHGAPSNSSSPYGTLHGAPGNSSSPYGLLHGAPNNMQPVVHPVLQQLNQLNAMYANSLANMAQLAQKDATGVPKDASEQEELGKMKEEGVHEAVSKEVFSVYEHKDIVKGCQPHPGDIVEAGPLATLTQPDPFYPLTDSIPTDIIQSGKLSSLQLEGVLYACQQHLRILPSGQRAGFFIGDAAGVGKGRQIAGIILDNFTRGRTKHIWFSISADLIVDTRRDLSDLGCYIKVIDGCQELDKETRVFGLPADFKEGVVFSTYATLVSSVQKGGALSTARQSRLQQLVNWCGGEEFEGCLVFDECHKAKNFVPGKEQASTKVALAVTSIQRLLPKARVLYCSATGVTDVKNMAFMERLGLWGEGAPFRSFENFLDSVQRKGLGMAEMLAMEMKTSGMYVSRGLSYKQAEFTTVEIPLSKDQRKVYDMAAHVWNELRKAISTAMSRTNFSGTRLWQQFWSCHQRFFKQLCMGMKVPKIIEESRKALEEGNCVVIGLQTTGEASLESEMTKNRGSVSGFVSLCREILSRFIQQYFPTFIEKQTCEEKVEDQWSKQAKELLLGFAEKIQLPNSPLDEIIDQLGGPECVAEMTGRRGRIVRRSQTDSPQYELRAANADAYGGIESLNVQERNAFMEGKKLVAIISDAASTGISLHADLRVANQRRRIHLTVELPWSADKAVQQLGRSHRSNQSSGPFYKLLTTDLGGERRFAAAVARRLQSLGALTKGDRRAASGVDLAEFNFDTPYGRTSLRAMYHNICMNKLVPGLTLADISDSGESYTFDVFNKHMQECLLLMGLVEEGALKIGVNVKDKDQGDVSKFLNRILGLSVLRQNLMFKYFTECMRMTVHNAKQEGRYNEGMLDITAASVEMVAEPKEVFTDLTKGTHCYKVSGVKCRSWNELVHGLDTAITITRGKTTDSTSLNGKSGERSSTYWLLRKKTPLTCLGSLGEPNTGLSQFDEERSDLTMRYKKISPEDAVGTRCYKISLLCGSIVTLMSVLETTLNRFSHQLGLSKSESNIRVVRVKLNNGERVVGVRYPEVLIPEVEKTLREQQEGEKLVQASMSQSVLGAGTQSSNNYPIKKVIIESVTDVNTKCQSRAFRPPVTIKSFFKAANHKRDFVPEKCDDNQPNDCNQKQDLANIKSDPDAVVSHSNKDEDVKEIDYTKFIDSCNEAPCRSPSRISSDQNVSNLSSQLCSEGSVGKSMKTGTKNTPSLNRTVSNSKKRPASSIDSEPAGKKRKQSNLASMFAKVASKKKEEDDRPPTCPICKKEFEKTTLNSELNQHIDNCLIE
ncbi:hypothetical protein FSP39_005887 [Pinctada imbricata]|uniref:Uncharacterized protein n=1 Tax=Pinctada imbricata TaxID=66713 RepID=A0AA88XY81_PINIB|nr:hypothetical protein FSP39_005887 [Pinctada imbricata]